MKDISSTYTGVTYNRAKKEIVGTAEKIKEFQKSADSKLFESTGWAYVVTDTKIEGDNEMIEFLDEKRLVLLPESIAKYLDNREDGETNVDSLLNLQVACDKVVNTQLSLRQEIQDYGSIPYKYRMKILVKLRQGYGYTSYERQQIEEFHYLPTPDMNELVNKIRKWAYNRGLTKADPAKQMLKVIEELGEVGAAMARVDLNELMDGIGDVTVTLIILAAQHELDFEHCLEVAYNEIKDRKGELVGGVFVKEEDLNNA